MSPLLGPIEITFMVLYVLAVLAVGAGVIIGAWSLWRIAKNLDRSVDLLEQLLTEHDDDARPGSE